MIFPQNNLPTDSRYWAREVEKGITNLTSSFKSAEINNTTRDSQLLVTANTALKAATDAQEAVATAIEAQADADAAQTAAISANSTAISANSTAISANATAIEALQLAQSQQVEIDDAQNTAIAANSTAAAAAQQAADAALAASTANGNALAALEDVVQLGAPGGPAINASNINAGTLNAGVVNVTNLNASNITSGSLSANRISGGTIDASSISVINLNASNITSGSLSADRISGGNIIGVNNITAGETIFATVNLGCGSNLGVSGSANITQGVTTGGAGQAGPIVRSFLAGEGTTGASFTNSGALVRTSSSRRYKTDIQSLNLELDDLYELEPKTFKRIEEVEQNPESARTYPGFIAEELAGTSLDKFVFYSKDEDGNSRPEGVHYPELTAALLLAIKDLNARLEALESR